MAKKRKHTTTKNTVARPPVTRLAEISGECNGNFTVVTDFTKANELDLFDKIFRKWFDHPQTRMWNIQSFIHWFQINYPDRMCVLKEDFDRAVKGKKIPATKEEWEAENN